MLLGTQHDCFCSSFGPLAFWLLMPKGERVDSGGVLRESFIFFVCYIHASCLYSHVYIPALAFCDMCAYEVLELYVDYLVSIISCHLIGSSS
jgi:hypothetical protein